MPDRMPGMAARDILKAISGYLVKTGLLYVVLMSGIASVVLQLIGLAHAESWGNLGILLASYVCLLIAGFVAWYREHAALNAQIQSSCQERQSLEGRLKELEDKLESQAQGLQDKKEKRRIAFSHCITDGNDIYQLVHFGQNSPQTVVFMARGLRWLEDARRLIREFHPDQLAGFEDRLEAVADSTNEFHNMASKIKRGVDFLVDLH